MSLCAPTRHIGPHTFFTFDTRMWSALCPGPSPPPKKKSPVPPKQETRGGGGGRNRTRLDILGKKILVSLGNQAKFSRSASHYID